MTGRVIPFPSRAPEPGDDESEFEELTRVGDQAEVLVVRSLLEAHGIEVLLRTHVAPSVHPFSVGDQGAVQVLVRREALAAARLLLARGAPGPSGLRPLALERHARWRSRPLAGRRPAEARLARARSGDQVREWRRETR